METGTLIASIVIRASLVHALTSKTWRQSELKPDLGVVLVPIDSNLY